MKLREWWIRHLPSWLWPVNPWGDKGREHMPDLHALVNQEQQLHLRVYRLWRACEQREYQERQHYQDWDRGHPG